MAPFPVNRSGCARDLRRCVYGGHGNEIENNLVYDTMNYPGVMLATDHDPLPFSGQTLIKNNGLYRTGCA